MGGMPMWRRVALTALARSRRESISVPSRSKIRSFMVGQAGSGHAGLRAAGPRVARHRLAARTYAAAAHAKLRHFPLQGVAVNAELFAGRGLVSGVGLQRPRNHAS